MDSTAHSDQGEEGYFTILGMVLGFLATCLIGVFILGAYSKLPGLEVLSAAGPLVIAIGVVIAFSNHRHTVQRMQQDERVRASKSYLDEAINTLERSFELLMGGKENINQPPNDRLGWLSAARTLLSYEKIKNLISISDHKLIIDEQEEYWRKRFYDVLQSNAVGFDVGYYRGGIAHKINAAIASGQKPPHTVNSSPPLDPKSLAVIYQFSHWPEGKADPMKKVDVADRLYKNEILAGNRGLCEFLEQDYHKHWKKIQARQNPGS